MTAADASAATDTVAITQFIDRIATSLREGGLVRLQLARPHPPAATTLEKLLVRPVLLRGQPQLQLVWRHHSQDITKNLPLADALALLAELLRLEFHHGHLVTRQHDVQLMHDRRRQRWVLRVGRLSTADAQPAQTDNALPTDLSTHQPDTQTTTASAAKARAMRDAGADSPLDRSAPAADCADTDTDADDAASGLYLGAAAGAPLNAVHDRLRQRPLDLQLPFLAPLGVADAQGRLVPAMARKWRQINKFAEVLGAAIGRSALAERACQPDAPAVRVLDFGAGKGYLTFAVHHLLQAGGWRPDVLGVELRPALTDASNAIVASLGLHGLRFAAGDVRSLGDQPCDIMIALHACDTATDVALHRGVAAGAALIVCSPCCHQQLRPQLHSPALLQPLLRHGIHMSQMAEMLTDALRALLLQLVGYDAQVFEFISPEHTSKNKMVLALRRSQPLPAAQRAVLAQQLQALKDAFGITQQALEQALRADGRL